MLTFPEKGFGLSVWSLSPSVVCNAVSEPLSQTHSITFFGERLEINLIFPDRESRRSSALQQVEVRRGQSDGKLFSLQRVWQLQFTLRHTASLSCSTLTGAETDRLDLYRKRVKSIVCPKLASPIWHPASKRFRKFCSFLPFQNKFTSSSLPWSSSRFSYSAPERNIACYQSHSAPSKNEMHPHAYRNPPTSFMASSICLSSSYRSLDSLSGCTIASSICGNS